MNDIMQWLGSDLWTCSPIELFAAITFAHLLIRKHLS